MTLSDPDPKEEKPYHEPAETSQPDDSELPLEDTTELSAEAIEEARGQNDGQTSIREEAVNLASEDAISFLTAKEIIGASSPLSWLVRFEQGASSKAISDDEHNDVRICTVSIGDLELTSAMYLDAIRHMGGEQERKAILQRPSGVIEFDAEVTEELHELAREEWRKAASAHNNAAQDAVLDLQESDIVRDLHKFDWIQANELGRAHVHGASISSQYRATVLDGRVDLIVSQWRVDPLQFLRDDFGEIVGGLLSGAFRWLKSSRVRTDYTVQAKAKEVGIELDGSWDAVTLEPLALFSHPFSSGENQISAQEVFNLVNTIQKFSGSETSV